jgi:diketogulonate reductase-like aldo/keto reductase
MQKIPKFIYGTAWKGADTTNLVKMAVSAGFTAIDTANQPKHYSESLVGDALVELNALGISRDQLFLQTKFTAAGGQDARIPYDPESDFATQVRTSFD